jgi:RNA polymerase sigma-70 factor (ECF subfamily)
LACPGGAPYDQTAAAELKARVEDALRKLPEAFRTVVVLRELEGFSYEEIAEIVEVPAGTVKSRLTRGRAALKEILVADGLGRILAGGPR